MPYDIPNLHVEYVRAEPPAVPTGFWRGVGPNNNVFAIECFMDELARKAGKDPVDFRRGMLDGNPRLKAALDLVAEKSGWGQPLPARAGRGVCVQPSFGSFIATVVEAEVDEHGEVHLRRVTSAVDTGIAVNPDTIVAQLQGGLIFGLTAALYGEITIENGRVQQSNFNDYRMLRIDEVPKIDVHVIKSGEDPGGIGETGATAGPPALRNAIYAATGVALRRLPIDREALAVAARREASCAEPACVVVVCSLIVAADLWLAAVRSWAVRLSPAARRSRWPTIKDANPTGVPADPRQCRCGQARRISGARRRLHGLPHRAGRRRPMPAGSRSRCRSARSIRPISRPTRRPASAITAMQDFLNAVQRGIRKDGTRLYPAMPYPSYTYMTDADALGDQGLSVQPAGRACGQSRRHADFPVSISAGRWRSGRSSSTPTRALRRTPRRAPQWNRGAYLAEALAHCGECHTPRNLAFALDNRKKFAGAVTAGWHAYNITSDKGSGIGAWSDDEVFAYLAQGHASGRGTAAGPMGEAVDESFSQMAPEDIHALVAYLRSVPPIASPDLPATLAPPAPASPTRKAQSPSPNALGKKIFADACASCHGWSGVSAMSPFATICRRARRQRSGGDECGADRDLRHAARPAGWRRFDAGLRQHLIPIPRSPPSPTMSRRVSAARNPR